MAAPAAPFKHNADRRRGNYRRWAPPALQTDLSRCIAMSAPVISSTSQARSRRRNGCHAWCAAKPSAQSRHRARYRKRSARDQDSAPFATAMCSGSAVPRPSSPMASIADLVIVVARTSEAPGSRGISLIFVEVGSSPASAAVATYEKLGHLSADTSELFFDDVEVPTRQSARRRRHRSRLADDRTAPGAADPGGVLNGRRPACLRHHAANTCAAARRSARR